MARYQVQRLPRTGRWYAVIDTTTGTQCTREYKHARCAELIDAAHVLNALHRKETAP